MVTKNMSPINSERPVNVSSVDVSPQFAPRMTREIRGLLPELASRYVATDSRTNANVFAVRMDKKFFVDMNVMANSSLISGNIGDFLIQYGEGESRKFKIASEKTFFAEYKLEKLDRYSLES